MRVFLAGLDEPPEVIVIPETAPDREQLGDLMNNRCQGIGFEADGYWYRIERFKIEHDRKRQPQW